MLTITPPLTYRVVVSRKISWRCFDLNYLNFLYSAGSAATAAATAIDFGIIECIIFDSGFNILASSADYFLAIMMLISID